MLLFVLDSLHGLLQVIVSFLVEMVCFLEILIMYLNNIKVTDLTGTIPTYLFVAFQGSLQQ